MLFKRVRRAAAVRLWICGASSVVLLGSLWTVGTKSVLAQSQIFSSGSTGADGPLNITAPGLTYFDPASIPNHKAGDTIFNFTTITIGSSSQLRLDSRVIPGPVYWLATGDVNIAGQLDLSGQPGHNGTNNRVDRAFSVAGAGGFGGGPGGGAGVNAEPGAGPGGGAAVQCDSGGKNGTYSGSQYLIPLVGGSGGSGGCTSRQTEAAGGGAGGGAILIASSTSITVSGTGSIYATGGPSGGSNWEGGGYGSGGAIRLVATTISLTSPGEIAVGGNPPSGFLRLEAFNLNVDPSRIVGSYATSTPFQVALPQGGPSFVKVISVNGVPITTNPFTFPDATINTSNPIPIVIQGVNIPPGATPTLTIISETGPDQVIKAPALAGTLASSTSTVKIAYPPGGSQGLVRATWSN